MKGLVKFAPCIEGVGLMDVPEPALIPGHLIIEVEAAGVCGTDLHIQSDEYPCNPPVILGHEFSGVVAEVASDVAQFRAGQRVTSMPYFSTCGVCEFCRTGQWNLCQARKSVGSGVNGAFARYVLVPERSVRLLPENVDFVGGSATEPLACCVHALLEKATVKPSDLVVVVGPGAIGLLASQVALASGASVVLVGTEVDISRLDLARRLGVQHTVNVNAQSAQQVVSDISGGRGADLVVECSGVAAGARTGYEVTRRQGQFVQMGIFGRKTEVDPDLPIYRELTIHHSFASAWSSWEYALRLMREGRVDTRSLITDTLPLDRWEEGFDLFRSKRGVKTVLLPKA